MKKIVIKEDPNALYMSKDGYQKLLGEIREIEKQINANNKERKGAFECRSRDGLDSAEFNEVERINNLLNAELRLKSEQLRRAIIVEKNADKEAIDIDDTVNCYLINSQNDKEEFTFKLVSYRGKNKGAIQEVSISSPLGKAVYKKNIGETIPYIADGNRLAVEIISKNLGLEQQSNAPWL